MQEGQLLYATETLITHQCCSCQCFYAIPKQLDEKARSNSEIEFYCPHGHPQVYRKSETTRLKEKIEKLEFEVQRKQDYIQEKNRQIEQLGYSLRAQKAAKTKIINRVKNGVCPCCNRTFLNLQNHFKTMHPELLETK